MVSILSTEHFIELIGKRVEDCEAWEGSSDTQGNLKDAREDKENQNADDEIIRRTPEKSITQEEITRTFDAMQNRHPSPKLTPAT